MSEFGIEDLARCREKIDELDRRIVELLNDRTSVVEEIGRIKQHLTLGIYEPKREEQVFANIVEHNSGPLPNDAIKRVFERIIDEMRNVQKLKMLADDGAEKNKAEC
ncbi:MAG: chorismate mutase [Bryobacterales bacterium]|nr:chorismate mutase [Bryobacterales bacterium]